MRKQSIAILMLLLPSSLLAAERIKPGLWEMTVKSDAFQGMQGIPPEQLEQLRQMGVTVPQVQGNTLVNKVCIPKAMAERDQPPYLDQQQTGCRIQNYQRRGQDYTANIVCSGPQMQGQGKLSGSIASSERFHSTYDFTGTMQGEQVNHHQESSAKWLSADCGNVKPLPDPGKGN